MHYPICSWAYCRRAQMTPYKYQPLRIDADEIRLLSLLPGSSPEETIISIETVPFGQNNWPQYEALSYTWGSSDDRVPLSIGALRNESLDITQNLATALPYLRLRDRPRVLWIDAICIDQKSLTERSHQVKRMGDIFQKVERVIVWKVEHAGLENIGAPGFQDRGRLADFCDEARIYRMPRSSLG